MSFFIIFRKRVLGQILINGIILIAVSIVFFTAMVGGVQPASKNTNGLKAFYSGNQKNSNVSLMVNVYWGNEYIVPMLDIIQQNNAKVTFFVGGSWVKTNHDLFMKIADSGNEIGNHGYNHKDSASISESGIIDEISRTHMLVQTKTGLVMNLFAPPSGSYNQLALKTAQRLGYSTIMWTKDTIDWRDKDSSLVYNRATSNPKNGDLILMHPTAHTLAALDNIIKFYLNKGFKLTTVSENILAVN